MSNIAKNWKVTGLQLIIHEALNKTALVKVSLALEVSFKFLSTNIRQMSSLVTDLTAVWQFLVKQNMNLKKKIGKAD